MPNCMVISIVSVLMVKGKKNLALYENSFLCVQPGHRDLSYILEQYLICFPDNTFNKRRRETSMF